MDVQNILVVPEAISVIDTDALHRRVFDIINEISEGVTDNLNDDSLVKEVIIRGLTDDVFDQAPITKQKAIVGYYAEEFGYTKE